MRTKQYLLALSIAAASGFSGFTPANCQSPAFSEPEVVKLVRQAKIVSSEAPVRAIIDGDILTLQTTRGANVSEKACKIDAVFMAKTVLDTYPKRISKIKILFAREADDKFNRIIVMPGVIEDYGNGKITEQNLLSSLPITLIEPKDLETPEPQQISVLPGPYREQRLLLLDRIESLKKKGTGVKPFQDMFNNVEAMIKDGKTTEADTAIDSLSQKLRDQESLRKQAEVLQRYKPSVLAAASPRSGSDSASAASAATSLPKQVDNHQPHRDPRAGQRWKQIKDKLANRNQEQRQECMLKLDSVCPLIAQEKLYDAERICRDLENLLGCSKEFENMLPEVGGRQDYTQGKGQYNNGQGWSNNGQGWNNNGQGWNKDGGPKGESPPGGHNGQFGPSPPGYGHP